MGTLDSDYAQSVSAALDRDTAAPPETKNAVRKAAERASKAPSTNAAEAA